MIFLGLLLASLGLILDQLSKFWAQEFLLNPPQDVVVFSFLNLSPSWNKGVSFGFLNDAGSWGLYFLIGLSIILCLLLVKWLFERKGYLFSAGIGLILGGALGNLMDRFLYGAVFDFIDVHYEAYHFWTFNIADSAITLGAILFIIDMLRDLGAQKQKG